MEKTEYTSGSMFLTSGPLATSQVEWEVSQGDLDAVKGACRLEANGRDQQNGELYADDKHAAYLDAEFELSRAELQLLRLTGELENWAIPSP